MASKDHCKYLKDKQDLTLNDLTDLYSNLTLNKTHKCAAAFDHISSKSAEIDRRKSSNNDAKESKKSWKNDKTSTTNGSTLSLHIAAYEDFIEAQVADSLAGKGSKKSGTTTTTASKISKQKLVGSFNDQFEFPRQHEDDSTTPEVQQFSASQKLFTPIQEPFDPPVIPQPLVSEIPESEVQQQPLNTSIMTNSFDQFAITEVEESADFGKTFTDKYSLLLKEHKNAQSLYKILIESVIVYFAKSYSENEVMSKAAEFLSQHFLQTTQEIKEKSDISIDQKCLECEVMILIELFILQSRPCPLSQTNIIKKFRFIYWNRGNETREFIDGTVCEQFLMHIPLYLTQIYEELDFDIPIELKKYESLENQLTEEPSEALINLNKEVKEKCKMLLKAVKPESASKSSSKSSLKNERKKQELRRSPRKSRPPLSYSPIKTFPRPKAKHDTPNKDGESNGRKRRFFVAETPEEKLAKKKKEDEKIAAVENEVVAQTPFDKIKKTSKAKEKDSKRLTELLKQSEDSKRRASKRLSFCPPNECSQSTSTSQNCISPSQSSSIIKHSNSLATFSRVSSTKSLSTFSEHSRKSAFSAPNLRSPIKLPAAAAATSSSNGSSVVTTPTSTVPDHLNAALTLSSDIIQKYRRRMDFVRLTSKKADSNEIFYGRLAGRPNLFNELNEAMAQQQQQIEKPITRSSAASASQKNRSGRKVEQDVNAVYIAHTLLNVHNETPLNPFKPPKDSPFKVRKLVRHATRADWKKLQKFIAKNHCERSDSASN